MCQIGPPGNQCEMCSFSDDSPMNLHFQFLPVGSRTTAGFPLLAVGGRTQNWANSVPISLSIICVDLDPVPPLGVACSVTASGAKP